MATAPGDTRPYASDDDITQMVESLYGFKVLSKRRLNGYEDVNLHIKVRATDHDNTNIERVCEAGYVVKVLNTRDTLINQSSIAGQVDLLQVLLDGGVICPRHIQDRNGEYFSVQDLPDKTRTGTTRHVVRLLEYIEGEIVYVTGVTPKLAYQSGGLAANMLNLMEGYEDSRLVKDNYLFNHDHLPLLRDYLTYVTHEGRKEMATQLLNKWDSLLETIATLPRGIIHYDVSEQNLLVGETKSGEKEIVGILDFANVSPGHKVYDIGICMMYLMTVAENPIDIAGYCLHGFLKNRELTQPELDVLYYCVAARFVVSLVLGLYHYSVTEDPYCIVTQEKGWKAFKELWDMSAEVVLKYWQSEKFRNFV